MAKTIRTLIDRFSIGELIRGGLPTNAVGCALFQLCEKHGRENVIENVETGIVEVYKNFTPDEFVRFLIEDFRKQYTSNNLDKAYQIAEELDQFLSKNGIDLLK